MDDHFYRKDIRPDFLPNQENDNKRSTAESDLSSVEQSASATPTTTENSLVGTKKNEESAGGFYSGVGIKAKKNNKGKGRMGFFKKRGPIVAIVLSILGVGGIMGGAQLFQPFSLVEQLRETFNSMQTSASRRSDVFFRMQMDSGRVRNPIKGKIFGADTFKITKSQRTKLARQGITVDDDFGGEGIRVLKFDDGTGEIRIVAADEKYVSRLNDVIGDLKTKGTDIDPDTKLKFNADRCLSKTSTNPIQTFFTATTRVQ